ncbi:MAG: hypothetical protein WBB25_00800 [Sulfitobacter sp.]
MKALIGFLIAMGIVPLAVSAQSINFGNDNSEWADDNECDDRRFRGTNMAGGLDRDDVLKDATDCRKGIENKTLSVWDFEEAKAATQCKALDFGNDSSKWANDGACDDYRFEGPGADYVLLKEDIGKDASDCRSLCEQGQIALRDY